MNLYISNSAFALLNNYDEISHEAKSIFYTVAYTELSCLSDISNKTKWARKKVSKLCHTLQDQGWLRLVQSDKGLRPECWVPKKLQHKLVDELKANYKMSHLAGEFLLGQLLEFWLRVPRIIKNARPPFLLNPLTQEPLEIDRYIPDVAGFEFNGAQHYILTEKYNSKKSLSETQARDLMKQALCTKQNILLVPVTAQDLGVELIKKVIPSEIPLHAVDINEPYASALEGLCANYRKKVINSK